MGALSRREVLAAAAALAVCPAGGQEKGAVPGSGEGMVLIPAGPFPMGTPAEDAAAMARRSGYHSGPDFGPLAPGTTAGALTRLYFVEASLKDWYACLRREMGAPTR